MRGELDANAMQDPVYRWGWKMLGWAVAVFVLLAAGLLVWLFT